MPTIDLNADLGESFGPWPMGRDADLLGIVTSANIACGMHAGDWDVMAKTIAAAAENGVGVGAHPGFPDLQGFGRRDMAMPVDSLRNLVCYQVGAARAMAEAAGAQLRHVKLHGAMANMASRDLAVARACLEGAKLAAPGVIAVVITGTCQQQAAQDLGLPWAGEVFADRAYQSDLTLVPRGQPGAVLHDPTDAASRVLRMIEAGGIETQDGQICPAAVDTICLHGDGDTAIAMARAIREMLEQSGITLCSFTGRQG
ncbi:LamB/YcsF family protein [Pseudoprimorskyibacter insulae]|uniref:5-oxoprolinase subunit A n=1 Tax=Pseudoprimorskyibacter insulae TaxID=1695997 RepID=A0A2R8AQ40_9RHOB|nr:5-oxoprolinase subunit PxpA [Pseudoprimorskyibacter insulae]SPF78135.1 hypothetical protein PRI8871_00727 [Pseudoprimorskyibacter insulae]